MSHDMNSPKTRRPRPPGNFDLVPHDFDTINVETAGEVAYWCANYRCTGSELRAAVAAVGPSSKAVAQYLRSTAGRPTADNPARTALNESSVRDVVESSLRMLLPSPYRQMFRELLERASAHPDLALHMHKRWIDLSPREAAIVAQVVATIVDEARLSERDPV